MELDVMKILEPMIILYLLIMKLDVMKIPEPMIILPFDNGIECDEDTGANDYLTFGY